jgi:UDP-2,3-diacylglucosamine hydrolase
MSCIGILAGGGRLPLMIAESVIARGESVHIVAIEGEADPAISRFAHTWVNWGQIGRMVAALQTAGGEQIVIAGGVKRPNLWSLRPDAGFFASLPQIVGLMVGGDDCVLTRVVHFFEGKGLRVRGAHEVAPDLLAHAGQIGSAALSERGLEDAALGFAVRAALGTLDAGQAVAVADGRVLAIEGAEGTDAMLQRVARLRVSGKVGSDERSRHGVLAKGPKPGQELRIDMPAIGPRTVEGVLAAQLEGIAVEAGAVLILDRADAVRAADRLGCAILGLPGTPTPGMARWQAARPSGYAGGYIVGRVIGRRRPSRRDAADIEQGLSATVRLAPFATGAGVVVSRAYILGLEAAEGVTAMLERIGDLRQWGLRGNRRVGVLVRRLDGGAEDEGMPEALLTKAAAQRLAGIAVIGPGAMLESYEGAARVADRAGLFLVTCPLASANCGVGA